MSRIPLERVGPEPVRLPLWAKGVAVFLAILIPLGILELIEMINIWRKGF